MNDTARRHAATTEEVISAFERLAAGTLSREAAVAWALTTTDGQSASSPFGTWPRDILTDFALRALLGCTATEENLQETGPPYFIRDTDIAEWLAVLRREDAPVARAGHLQPKRPHQFRNAPHLAGLIEADVASLCRTLGLEHLRGVDDLDFYQELVFDDSRGRQLFLSWRPRADAPTQAEVYLEGDGRDCDASLRDVLEVLRLPPEAIAWRPS